MKHLTDHRDRMERMDKSVLRSELAARRNSLSLEEREWKSKAASNHAIAYMKQYALDRFMVYISFRSELDLSDLIEWGWQSGKEVIIPRCKESDRSMTLHRLTSWKELTAGAYGIMEPDASRSPQLEEGDWPGVVFVPGLAFDLDGGRLGYGGGYYDRLAERVNSSVMPNHRLSWIGTGFAAQLVEHVPAERHDVRMDAMLTEDGLIEMSK